MEMQAVAFAGMSGGQGKTTCTLLTGKYLARGGKRVLLVDCNAQASLTFFSGVEVAPTDPTLYEVLLETVEPIQGVYGTPTENLFLMPADEGLYRARTFMQETGIGSILLKMRLEALADRFDYCLIDTPPEHQDFVNMAIVAADKVVIPALANSKGVNSLMRTLNVIKLLRKVRAFQGSVLGVIPFQDDWRGRSQTHTSREAITLMREIASDVPCPVLPSIRYSNAFERAIDQGKMPSELSEEPAKKSALLELEYPFEELSKELEAWSVPANV